MLYPRGVLRALCVLSLISCGGAQRTSTSFTTTCAAIADDIETLTRQYPQLREYRAVDSKPCSISYGYHTHRADHAGGWSASVPNPDPDGVWFHIGVWDPKDPVESSSQINTQPVLPPWWIGDRRVTFLILEGTQTKPIGDALITVLRRHGMTER